MSTQPKTRLTIEEYLELDKNSEEKFEYFDGEVFNMSGCIRFTRGWNCGLPNCWTNKLKNAAAPFSRQTCVSKFRSCRHIVIPIYPPCATSRSLKSLAVCCV